MNPQSEFTSKSGSANGSGHDTARHTSKRTGNCEGLKIFEEDFGSSRRTKRSRREKRWLKFRADLDLTDHRRAGRGPSNGSARRLSETDISGTVTC